MKRSRTKLDTLNIQRLAINLKSLILGEQFMLCFFFFFLPGVCPLGLHNVYNFGTLSNSSLCCNQNRVIRIVIINTPLLSCRTNMFSPLDTCMYMYCVTRVLRSALHTLDWGLWDLAIQHHGVLSCSIASTMRVTRTVNMKEGRIEYRREEFDKHPPGKSSVFARKRQRSCHPRPSWSLTWGARRYKNEYEHFLFENNRNCKSLNHSLVILGIFDLLPLQKRPLIWTAPLQTWIDSFIHTK